MDNFLYILFIIGWIAFTIYQQNQKKKRKEAALMAHEASESLEKAEEKQANDIIRQVLDATAAEVPVPEPKDVAGPVHTGNDEENFAERDVSLEVITETEAQSLEEIPADMLESYTETGEIAVEKKFVDIKNVMEVDKDEKKREKEIFLDEEEDALKRREFHFNLRNAVIYAEILNAKYVN